MAYYRAVCSFFAWLEQHGIGELADIEPFHVAAYIKALRVSDPGNRAVRERAAARPPSSSTWLRSGCCLTGLSPARFSPSIRRMRCEGPSTS
jgi:hypothetical protein